MTYTKISLQDCLCLIAACSLFAVIAGSTDNLSGDSGCQPKLINGDERKVVCVCNAQHCPKLAFDWPQLTGQAVLVQSNQVGLRFSKTHLVENSPSTGTDPATERILVNLENRHQEILGWGGAFTDSSGINIAKLDEKLADTLLSGYYGEDGLQYNFGRVPMGGSDFSSRPYSYDDTQGPDYNLTHWALAPDDTLYKIPYIKRAAKMTGSRGLKLFASPWSPPTWMKTSNNFVKGELVDDDMVYRSYAEYLCKFYDAYLEHGIRFWGATVQNEPLLPSRDKYTWNSLEMNTQNTTNFLAKFLIPALKSRGYTKQNFKLMLGDDSLELINEQVPEILRDKEVQEFASGLAFHWYWSGWKVPYSALDDLYEQVKDKIEFVLMTEACEGFKEDQRVKVDLGSWGRGESYASDIIEDLHRHTAGWIDWNLALDMQGGPNWAENYVDSPIIVNGDKNEFYQQPMYYVLAHFSRFFKPGSVRVDSEVKRSGGETHQNKDLMVVAVHNQQSGHVVVNVLNKSNSEKIVEIVMNNQKRLVTLSGKSINSVIVKI